MRVRQTTLTSAWVTGGNMNTARLNVAGSGAQTAALAFGGRVPPGSTYTAVTETYDGTSWTEVNDLNQAREQSAGFGSQTAAICAAVVILEIKQEILKHGMGLTGQKETI